MDVWDKLCQYADAFYWLCVGLFLPALTVVLGIMWASNAFLFVEGVAKIGGM